MVAPIQILAVDDSRSNLEIIQEMLSGRYSVEAAQDGAQAIRLAELHPPRVVLLDVMLPGIDGYETCRRLRRLPGMCDSRIIMVTAKALPAERAAGLEAGADAYLTKPFAEAELLAAIQTS